MNTTESLKKQNNMLRDIIILAVLLAYAFIINSKLRLTGLYMDDLYMWSCYGEQSFLKYVFPMGSTRCRFVYWFFAWLELGAVQNHIGWIVPINILTVFFLASMLYLFAKKLSGSGLIGFICGILFLTSRFSYYQVGQLLGLMESLALFFALLICYFLYRYTQEVKNNPEAKKTNNYFHAALISYFLVCFTHERYIVLIPMFLYVLIKTHSKNRKLFIFSLLDLFAVILIRRFMTGGFSPAGTGGTTISDTFTIKQGAKNLLSETAYLFGINAGPEHLCGVSWPDVSMGIKVTVILSVLVLLAWFIRYFSVIIAKPDRRKGYFIFFLGFIIGCMVSSATTIRVEMRWIYAPYTFSLLLLAYTFGCINNKDEKKEKKNETNDAKTGMAVFESLKLQKKSGAGIYLYIILFGLLSIISDTHLRNGYKNIYLFLNQKRYNSLADETFGRYGSDIFGKEIIIIGNSYEMSDFTAETFFKTFDPLRKAQQTVVSHVESERELSQVRDNQIILKENAEFNTFTDVTDMVRTLKCEIISGYYRDEWMDKEAELYVMTGEKGKINIEMMIPDPLDGTEMTTITVGEDDERQINLTSSINYYTIEAEPYTCLRLRFSNNFTVDNPQETRGEYPFSMIAGFKSE